MGGLCRDGHICVCVFCDSNVSFLDLFLWLLLSDFLLCLEWCTINAIVHVRNLYVHIILYIIILYLILIINSNTNSKYTYISYYKFKRKNSKSTLSCNKIR